MLPPKRQGGKGGSPAVWLPRALLLVAVTLAGAAAASGQPSPRIYIYELPEPLATDSMWEKCYGDTLEADIRRSAFYEPDASKADYYWVPGGGRYRSPSVPISLLHHVRAAYPWWNATVQAGQARHIMVTTFDGGPGEVFGQPTLQSLSPDMNPVSPSRNVLFLSFNGLQDGAVIGQDRCGVCFQRGKDIMIPSPQGTCGPLCGYSMETLRQKSVWAQPPPLMQAQLTQKRKHTMFFGGQISNPHAGDYTGRGGAYVLLGNKTGYHIARSGFSPKISFPDAMLDAEFCYSPLGGNGGDPDRYVPGMLFGCLPVMLNTSHHVAAIPNALPLEEVLPWHEFGTVVDSHNIKDVKRQLECLMPRVVGMRARLQALWPSFLYTSIHGSYLNETGTDDAFAAIMRVLASRVPHGFKPSAEVAKRLTHPGTLFPCRPDSPGRK